MCNADATVHPSPTIRSTFGHVRCKSPGRHPHRQVASIDGAPDLSSWTRPAVELVDWAELVGRLPNKPEAPGTVARDHSKRPLLKRSPSRCSMRLPPTNPEDL